MHIVRLALLEALDLHAPILILAKLQLGLLAHVAGPTLRQHVDEPVTVELNH